MPSNWISNYVCENVKIQTLSPLLRMMRCCCGAWIFKFAWYFACNCTWHYLTKRGNGNEAFHFIYIYLFNCLLYHHRKTRAGMSILENLLYMFWQWRWNLMPSNCHVIFIYRANLLFHSNQFFLCSSSYSFIWFPKTKKNMSELGEKYAHILSMSLFPH